MATKKKKKIIRKKTKRSHKRPLRRTKRVSPDARRSGFRPPTKLERRKKSRPSKSAKDVEQFILNPDFEFFDELRTLILKASPAERNSMIRRISRLGRVKLAVISGILLNASDGTDTSTTVADLFLVADDVNRSRLTIFLKSLEAEVGKEIRFGLMEREEFDYRFGMFDRFVRVLLEGPHEKIINKLGI